jgi:NTP pyrophosphatase (non-canonical NTP hydrolase)
MNLEKYLFKRIAEDQINLRKERPQLSTSRLYVNERDIQKYLWEYEKMEAERNKNDLLKNYQRFVNTTTSYESRKDRMTRLNTAAIGICAEGGEFAEIVKKILFQGKPLTNDAKVHMKKELGDVMWYIVQGCYGLDIDLETVIKENIKKLEARYPNGFEMIRSENRNEGDI